MIQAPTLFSLSNCWLAIVVSSNCLICNEPSIARAHLSRFLQSRGIVAIAVVVGIAASRRHSIEILEF